MAAPPNKFPWDYDVPNDAFWTSLPFTTGRNFLQCFQKSEIEALSSQFDASLSTDDKHRLLLRIVQAKLAEAREAASQKSNHHGGSGKSPLLLHEINYDAWQKFMLAQETMQHNLGLVADEEATLKEMLAHPRPGQDKNWSALNMMSRLLEQQGRYAEAEGAALEVQPWMEAHAQVGRGSPPAMGNMRMILTAVWKQGRFDDARSIYKEMHHLVDDMGNGKFAQYQEEEAEMLETLMTDLEKWKLQHQ
ncbi:hypothetical protein PFICI_03963 [Pestalotiopsis fici W106-1]|uniref:MalT-like TPR region domain-containing protein n=1 Tax=Pestalotiopsis fici (strain W106-1 / CGMCC3.15140) TaxID=1229662 RepID=W3XIN9_PESFW|nr:uncharacterized protein PFICI_03963 [Pestalotiopsis fici W106-1]ETS85938.1 hypothetical protein PFICI_03963 [Pestalotiopsis fici W106-1]